MEYFHFITKTGGKKEVCGAARGPSGRGVGGWLVWWWDEDRESGSLGRATPSRTALAPPLRPTVEL